MEAQLFEKSTNAYEHLCITQFETTFIIGIYGYIYNINFTLILI